MAVKYIPHCIDYVCDLVVVYSTFVSITVDDVSYLK